MIIKIFVKNENDYRNFYLFLLGLLLSMSIGLRANILPACLVMITYIFYEECFNRKGNGYLYLFLGLSLTLSIPIHNYYFSNTFVPLTIAAYKDWNLGAKPSDYFNLIVSILSLKIDLVLWNKIIEHINGEIKLYEIWYHLSIFSCLFYTLKRKTPSIIRFISISALSLISMLFFYHVGGRYSYLAWTLSLIILAYWMRNFILPSLKRIGNRNAS